MLKKIYVWGPRELKKKQWKCMKQKLEEKKKHKMLKVTFGVTHVLEPNEHSSWGAQRIEKMCRTIKKFIIGLGRQVEVRAHLQKAHVHHPGLPPLVCDPERL